MNKGATEPGPETHNQNGGQGKLSRKAQKRHGKKQDARDDPPEGAPGKLLHDAGITAVLQIHPHQNQSAGEGHHADEAGGCGQFFPDGGGRKDNRDAQGDFDKRLHECLSV